MAFDAYLHIDGIKGESTDSTHKDWIEVLSYSPSTPQPAPTAAASGGSGKVKMQDFHFVKKVDKASPKLHLAASSGKHINKVIIELMRSSGDSKVKYMTITMDQVFISKVSSAGLGGQAPVAHPSPPLLQSSAAKPAPSPLLTENVHFNYGSIQWTYSQQ